MTDKKPLLSICIPTYNREIYLKRLLDSIICQKEFTETDDIEIVIDDGPSKDNTETLVKEYQKRYKNIRYFRNTKAVGMTASFLEAISFSNGKYTRLFGSDDFMNPEALKIILSIIKNKKPKIILSSRKEDIIKNETIDKNIIPNISTFNGFNDFSVYLGYNEKEKYYDKANYFTFISIFCFETEYYKNAYNHLINNIGYSESSLKMNYFNFSLIGFAKLHSSDLICTIDKPNLVFCEPYNHGWKLNKKISSDLKILMTYIKNNYTISNNCKNILNKIFIGRRISCNLLAPIKDILTKIGVYENIANFIKKNIEKYKK